MAPWGRVPGQVAVAGRSAGSGPRRDTWGTLAGRTPPSEVTHRASSGGGQPGPSAIHPGSRVLGGKDTASFGLAGCHVGPEMPALGLSLWVSAKLGLGHKKPRFCFASSSSQAVTLGCGREAATSRGSGLTPSLGFSSPQCHPRG